MSKKVINSDDKALWKIMDAFDLVVGQGMMYADVMRDPRNSKKIQDWIYSFDDRLLKRARKLHRELGRLMCDTNKPRR